MSKTIGVAANRAVEDETTTQITEYENKVKELTEQVETLTNEKENLENKVKELTEQVEKSDKKNKDKE